MLTADGLAVGLLVGVRAAGLAVRVGVGVKVGEPPTVAVAVGAVVVVGITRVDVGVATTAVPVAPGDGVSPGVVVAVGDGARVGLGSAVSVGVGDAVAVAAGCRVGDGRGVEGPVGVDEENGAVGVTRPTGGVIVGVGVAVAGKGTSGMAVATLASPVDSAGGLVAVEVAVGDAAIPVGDGRRSVARSRPLATMLAIPMQ